MITIPKYRDAVAGHLYRSRVRAYAILAVGFTLFFLGWLVLDVLGALGERAFLGLTVMLIASAFVAAGSAALYHERPSPHDPRLVCPHCDGPLQLHGAIVILTRNCPHCGQRVLAD